MVMLWNTLLSKSRVWMYMPREFAVPPMGLPQCRVLVMFSNRFQSESMVLASPPALTVL